MTVSPRTVNRAASTSSSPGGDGPTLLDDSCERRYSSQLPYSTGKGRGGRAGPGRLVRARYRGFSHIRTMTVGSGIAPDLLTRPGR